MSIDTNIRDLKWLTEPADPGSSLAMGVQAGSQISGNLLRASAQRAQQAEFEQQQVLREKNDAIEREAMQQRMQLTAEDAADRARVKAIRLDALLQYTNHMKKEADANGGVVPPQRGQEIMALYPGIFATDPSGRALSTFANQREVDERIRENNDLKGQNYNLRTESQERVKVAETERKSNQDKIKNIIEWRKVNLGEKKAEELSKTKKSAYPDKIDYDAYVQSQLVDRTSKVLTDEQKLAAIAKRASDFRKAFQEDPPESPEVSASEGTLSTSYRAANPDNTGEVEAVAALQDAPAAGMIGGVNPTDNEELRVTKDGRQAIFDKTTKKFLRYASAK